MSILGALQTYLEEFPEMQLQPILTDMTGGKPSSYAVAPSGNSKTVEDIIGNRRYINNYVFYAKEYTAEEENRADNYDFLDSFFEWIEDRNEAEIFPVLPKGYVVDSISASNTILFEVTDDGVGIYQIQIQLTFERRKSNGQN